MFDIHTLQTFNSHIYTHTQIKNNIYDRNSYEITSVNRPYHLSDLYNFSELKLI